MDNFQELISQATIIKEETAPRQNTAKRVGSILLNIVNVFFDFFKSYEDEKPKPYDKCDFAIGDDVGYDIVRFSGGHVRTMNFDSSRAATKQELAAAVGGVVHPVVTEEAERDFELTDGTPDRNVVVAVEDGYPRTRNFNGRKVSAGVDSALRDIEHLKTGISAVDPDYNWDALGENPIGRINFCAGFAAIFRKIGFIGDSLSSGTHVFYDDAHPTDRTSAMIREYSWGAMLARLCGNRWDALDPSADCYNFSVGGWSAKSWLNAADSGSNLGNDKNRGWATAMKPENHKQAYTIALGVNDSGKEESLYAHGCGVFEDAVDVSNYGNNDYDTFVGNYAGIVQRLREVNPKCHIFCITMPKSKDAANHTTYNAQIRRVADELGCWTIDLERWSVDYSFRSIFNSTMIFNGHMGAVGYQYSAFMIATYIDWIVRKNPSAFAEVAFIGTDRRFSK